MASRIGSKELAAKLEAQEARIADLEQALGLLLDEKSKAEPKTKKEPAKAQKEPK